MPGAARPAVGRVLRGAGVLALAWAAVAVAHLPLLRLPYYWDEAGYYIPAAHDFLLSGTLIPVSTLTNAHPPLPSLLLAAAWRLFGFRPVVTRLLVSAFAAAALLAVYFLARAFVGRKLAAAACLLTALYPVWFAQSTLAHADIFAAAFTLWALAELARRGRPGAVSVLCLFAAVLSKETAIVTPLALFLYSLATWLRKRHGKGIRDAAAWALPALPLAAWYAYHRARTGFTFGNPEYLRYNATSNLHVGRIVFALTARLWHLAGHMNLWVPLLLTLALWLFPRRDVPAQQNGLARRHRRTLHALACVFALNVCFFSIAGGALLTRYLLPLFPLVLLFHLWFWSTRLRTWWIPAAVTAIAFVVGWTVNPPYGFTAEDNLSYRDVIVLTQQAIAQLPPASPEVRVLSAWPVTDALSKPLLGYVVAPYQVTPVQDLTAATLLDLHGAPFTHAIVFPSGPEPLHRLFRLGGSAGQANQSYFGSHENVDPATAARLLGEPVAWQRQIRGEWMAVLSAPQPVVDARLLARR